VDTNVFESARLLLVEIYGSLSAVESGTSLRCKRADKGKITLYRSGFAPGNRGEIAFDVESMAGRAGKSIIETERFLAELKATNGRPTEQNLQYDWPRVGFSTIEEAQFIALRLKHFFGLTEV
jgi:RNA 3'-terminal phosphate cyclase